MDTIDCMRAVMAVAQKGSFTAAGRQLGMSTKLVSKYVAAVEARLESQLFARTTRNVALTDTGAAYVERCAAILDQIDELEAVVKDRQSSLAGPIRITASTGFGSIRLARVLASFMAEHPEVTIDLHLSNSRVAIVEEGFDIAIRIGVLRDSTLIARRLAPMPMIVCAAPDYLDEVGRPERPADLARMSCLIDTNFADPTTWRFQRAGRETVVKVGSRFTANAPMPVSQLAIAGLGVARCVAYVVEDAIADGELERILPEYETTDSGLFALYPPNRHLTARVRALIDFLADAFAV